MGGWNAYEMTPQAWIDRYPHLEEHKVKPLKVTLNVSHGQELLDLGYELVWATTWEHEANTWIGPKIGLPKLPVVEFPKVKSQNVLCWKTETLVEYANGCPFAWIDDDISSYDKQYVRDWLEDDSAFLLDVDPWMGIARYHFDALRAWARSHGSE